MYDRLIEFASLKVRREYPEGLQAFRDDPRADEEYAAEIRYAERLIAEREKAGGLTPGRTLPNFGICIRGVLLRFSGKRTRETNAEIPPAEETPMSKNMFAVVFTKGGDKGAILLKEAYPNDHYHLGDDTYLVADSLSDKIAEATAMTKERGEEGVRGAVFKLNGSYTGYTRRGLWEWLENIEAAE